MKKNIVSTSAITIKYLRANGFKRTASNQWVNINNNQTYTTAVALETVARRERRVLENSINWFNVGSNQWTNSMDAKTRIYSRIEAFTKETSKRKSGKK